MAEYSKAEILRSLYDEGALPQDKMDILKSLEDEGQLNQGLEALSNNQQFVSSLTQPQPAAEQGSSHPMALPYATREGGMPKEEYSPLEKLIVGEEAVPPEKTPLVERPSEETAFPESEFTKKMQEYGKKLAYDLGITARWGTEGTARAIGAITDPFGQMMARATGREYQPLEEYTSEKLTQMGLPEEVERYRRPGELMRTVTGAAVPMAAGGMAARGATGLTQQVGRVMAEAPTQQLAGAAGASVGQQAAEEAGAGTAGQIAASLVGGIAGSKAAGVPKTTIAPKQIPTGAMEAEKRGIRTFTSDVARPKTAVGKIIQRTADMIFGGTGSMRAAQQEERIVAIKDMARQYGAETTAPFIDDVYKDLEKNWSNRLGKFYKAKTEVINRLDNRGAVPIDKTIKKIDDEIAKLKADAPSGANDALINEFENFKTDLADKSLTGIETVRSRLGSKLADDPSLAHLKDQGEKIAGRLYKSLNDDMGNFIKGQGDPKDFTKWKVGNKGIAKLNENLRYRTLRSVLKSGKQNPEDVRKLLLSNKPSDNKVLYNNLTKEGRDNARTALIQEAIEKAGGIDEFTPDKFKNQLKRLSKQTGIFFRREDADQIKGLYKALKFTEGAGQGVAAPRTGEQVIKYIMMMFGGAAGAQISPEAAAAGVVAIPAALGSMARIYNSKPVKNLLMQMSRITPGSKEEAALAKRLWATMQTQYDKEEKPQ